MMKSNLMSQTMQESQQNDDRQCQDNVVVDLSCNSDSVKQSIYMVFHTLMAMFAIYLSWKCNSGQFDIVGFLIAIFCPYLYIIYTLATRGTCDNPAA